MGEGKRKIMTSPCEKRAKDPLDGWHPQTGLRVKNIDQVR